MKYGTQIAGRFLLGILLASSLNSFGQCATNNFVVKSTGAGTTCSQIYDNGNNTGIGTGSALSFYLTNSGSPDITPRLTLQSPGGNASLLIRGGTSGSTGYWPDMGFALQNTNNLTILGASLQGVIMTNSAGSERMDLAFLTKPSAAQVAERLRITSAGNVGVGTTTPQSALDVNGGLAIGTYAGSTAAPSNGAIISGSVGIGTSAPSAPLSVAGGISAISATSSGTQAKGADISATASSASSPGAIGINVTASSPGQAIGIEVGTNVTGTGASTSSSGIQSFCSGGYSAIGANVWGFGANTNYGVYGNAGSPGSGGVNYGAYGNANGTYQNYGVYGIASGGSNCNYGIYASYAGTQSLLNAAGYMNGALYGSGGFYSPSDENLKKNIKQAGSVLAQLMKLDVNSYSYKNEELKGMNLPEGEQIGIMAQNLKAVYPNLVKMLVSPKSETGKDVSFLAVNYTALVPVLVQAVKELNSKTERISSLEGALSRSDAKIQSMQAVLDDICNGECAALKSQSNFSSATESRLSQNTPNPFSQQTTISYVIASGTNALINVVTLDGKLVKRIELSGKGSGSVIINAGELAPGTYTYSLIIDGQVTDTKLMVIISSER